MPQHGDQPASHLCEQLISWCIANALQAEPEWLARPSGACCLKGHLHSGESKGTFERLAGVETYVTKPAAGKDNGNVVIYYPDVFGFFTNGLLVCDSFAEAVSDADCNLRSNYSYGIVLGLYHDRNRLL